MVDLLLLAERCEKASGPDRELDGLIQRALGPDHPVHFSGSGVCNAFTGSIDAAMMLVDRYGVLLHLSDIGADGLPLCNIGDSVTAREFKGFGTANLALAVCAAALRARHSLKESS